MFRCRFPLERVLSCVNGAAMACGESTSIGLRAL